MIACLRSARFRLPDDSASVLVELRRHHDLGLHSEGVKEFVVTQRLSRLPVIRRKVFGTYREATRYWDEQVLKLTEQGFERRDAVIVGFHEEG